MIINWDEEKNEVLKKQRNISFEDILVAILESEVVDDLENTNKNYSHQRILIVNIDNYIYVVPYVQTKEEIFLKTIYPSRKLTKKYLNK